ncbi:MAG: T9SS type A sorting domain-containing protein, partial [Bacteroidota bacterium]
NGSLTFAGTGAGEGIVSATPGNLILHAPATITGYAQSAPPATQDYNFVDGTVQWTTDPAQATYDFPVGDATNGLQRMSITRNDVAADGITSLEASYDHTPPGIPANQNQCGINTPSPWTQNLYPGKFVFHANGGAAYTLPASSYDLEMAFRGTLPPGPEYGVLIDHGSGWEYAKVNSGPSPTSCVQPPQASPITAPGLTQFSEGSGIGNSLPFPFELLSFSARHIDGVNTLQWQTASETNNRGFDIQRAQALGERFESIGFVEGAGNSQRELSYAHPDADVLPGQTYYYRLVQEDFDGTRTPSPVVQVYVPESGEQYLQLYPNPATNQLTLSATQPLQTIVVRSSIGQEVLRQDAANETQVELDVSALSAGVYLLQTDGQALRFVKQ